MFPEDVFKSAMRHTPSLPITTSTTLASGQRIGGRSFLQMFARRYDPPKPGLLQKRQSIGEFDLPYAEEIIKNARTNEKINPLRIEKCRISELNVRWNTPIGYIYCHTWLRIGNRGVDDSSKRSCVSRGARMHTNAYGGSLNRNAGIAQPRHKCRRLSSPKLKLLGEPGCDEMQLRS
ncbi:GL25393 [Drosophila persimilis]|uniref:GL25393 n=1 Tax=Drosophila persimilis TaxID=7234 RepID=B4HCI4_DROPE|nr:GL25393 [Drosophila persimilis]